MDQRRRVSLVTPQTAPRGHRHAEVAIRENHSRPSAAVFRHAAAIYRDQYRVTEQRAYAMLVHGAAEAGTSVRQMAHSVIAGYQA